MSNPSQRKKPTSPKDNNRNGGIVSNGGNISITQSGATDDTFQTADDPPYADSDDPIGMHITNLLNAGAFDSLVPPSSSSSSLYYIHEKIGFLRKGHDISNHNDNNNNNSSNSNDDTMSLFPLLSRANYEYVKDKATRMYHIAFNIPSFTTVSTSNNNNKMELMTTHPIELPTHAQSMKMTFTFIIVSSIVISTCTHIILSFIVILYLTAFLFIMSVLVDFNDVYEYVCPTIVQRFIDYVIATVTFIGLEYTFQRRFHGRDQWCASDSSYQHLIDRQIPHVLALDKRRQMIIMKQQQQQQQENNTQGYYPPLPPPPPQQNDLWQCQNVHWDDVYHKLSTQQSNPISNYYTNNSTNKSLSKSTLDHLIANNYCYVMVHGKDKHQVVKQSKQKKRKVQSSSVQRKMNDTSKYRNKNGNNTTTTMNSTNNTNITLLGSKSEDICESMNDNGLNSVQSMDAIEIIRQKSTQRKDMMNYHHKQNLHSSPCILKSKGQYKRDNGFGDNVDGTTTTATTSTGMHGRRSRLNTYESERRSRLNTYESDRGSVEFNLQQHQHNDFSSNHSDTIDLLTYNVSQEYSYDDITNSFLSEDVSYSSTSYDEDDINKNNCRRNPSNLDDDHNISTEDYNDHDDDDNDNDSGESKSENDDSSEPEDMKWLDVGAKIGMRLLESEKLHQAITKSQMPSNLSSSYSGGAEDAEEGRKHQSIYYTKNQTNEGDGRNFRNMDSPKHVAKPFHAMWTSPNVENQYYDDGLSEDDVGYSYSELGDQSHLDEEYDDIGTHHDIAITGIPQPPLVPPPPSLSKRARSNGTSLSPTIKPKKKIMKPLRGGNTRSMSLPSSPVRSRSICSNRFPSETNLSVLSPDTNQLVKQFDANRYLPPSMAIHHVSVTDDVNSMPTSNKMDTNIIKKKRELLGRLNVKTDSISDFQPKKSYKESTRSKSRRRLPLLPGVRMIVPIFPAFSRSKKDKVVQTRSYYQFATVASSKRINASSSKLEEDFTDCLSITVLLDKSFLRSGKFAEMTMRIYDSQRFMPRHSKFPIGSCVATTFGVGVLVGWRAEDDCHIIRALWQKRGKGAAHAYLNRNALHEIVEAGVGFNVGTTYGSGKVIAYVDAGRMFTNGKYVVLVKKSEGRTNRIKMELNRSDIKTCHSSKFIPVVEQIKEAAKYQIQVNTYEAAKLQRILEDESLLINQTWRVFSEGFELFLSSFIKAAEEDDNIDSEIHNFLSSAIAFLEDFDLGSGKKGEITLSPPKVMRSISESTTLNLRGTGMWIVDDLLGHVLPQDTNLQRKASTRSDDDGEFGSESYKKVYAALNTAARTIAIARSSCTESPNLKMALAITHEVLILIHNVIKVQQVNMSKSSVQAWQKTLAEFSEVFGSINARLQSIGNGIIQRLQEHGKVAKVRAIRFADTLISDDLLMKYLENGEVSNCLQRVEIAAVSANVMDTESCKQYHDIGLTLYNTLAPRNDKNQEAAVRSGKKITLVAKILKILATPGRSILKLLMNNEVLELMERVFVRIFEKENDASLTLNIYSWNFRTLRHLRILNNMAISGGLWAPVLDAADEEFTWAVSRTPTATRDYVVPVSKLFSLGVARFHQLYQSEDNISLDWLDFLKEEEAVKIIQDLDAALMLSLKNLCKDVQEMMQVLPYYSSIDEDILRLIDEVDLKKELKEVGEAIVDTDKFPQYIREKSAHAVSKFLDYLPKMSIPIERREIGEDWVVTCRGRNGKDLTLSKVNIEKENLLCQVLGGENVLQPVIEEYRIESKLSMSSLVKDTSLKTDEDGNVEVSILDHVAELIRNAQNHGCWKVGSGGIVQYESPIVAGSSLEGLPLSEVLLCAIDLWENLEIDDDELLEIAIRDVSHQIQLQKKRSDMLDRDVITDTNWAKDSEQIRSKHKQFTLREAPGVDACRSNSSEMIEKKFNPKKDPTVLYLSMSELTCCLDDFTYRIEPAKRISMFDPVFEGIGTLSVKNASIKIRIECRKERIKKLNEEVTVPILQLQDLDVGLEQVNFRFKETGADWLLNKIIANFTKGITQIVRDNMKEQISLSINEVLLHLNSYIEVNPDLMLKILGITIDDLEENVAWV